MKASLQWMNEYVPLDLNRPAQELADELTQAGYSCRRSTFYGSRFEKNLYW